MQAFYLHILLNPLLTFSFYKLTHEIYSSFLISVLVICFIHLKTLKLKIEKEILYFFIASFLISLLLSSLWGEIYPSGEKLRDFALLANSKNNFGNLVEPWLPDFSISYYTYWYDLGGIFSNIFRVDLKYIYIGLVALFFSLYQTVFYEITRKIFRWNKLSSLLMVLLVSFGSNQAGLKYVFGLTNHWWDASRAISHTINEFPFWSFMFFDLHPHFMNYFLSPLYFIFSMEILNLNYERKYKTIGIVALFILFYRLVFLCNPWDIFIFCTLFVYFLVKIYLDKESDKVIPIDVKLSTRLATLFLGLFLLLFYRTPTYFSVLKIRIIDSLVGRSDPKEFLSHWGFWLFPILICLFINIKKLRLHSIIFFLGTLFFILLPELIYLDDMMSPPYERMNFVFKIYTGGWTLMALASIIFLSELDTSKFKMGILAFLTILMIPFSLKTIMERIEEKGTKGIYSRIDQKWNGAEFVINEFKNLPYGTSVQSSKSAYDETGLISILAEKNLYLGWTNHLYVLGYDYQEMVDRTKRIEKIYTEIQCESKKEHFKKTKAQYLVITPQEIKDYPTLLYTDFSCFKNLIGSGDFRVFAF